MWECVHLYMCEFISVEGCAWVLYLESPMKAVVDCEDIQQIHCGHSSPGAGGRVVCPGGLEGLLALGVTLVVVSGSDEPTV